MWGVAVKKADPYNISVHSRSWESLLAYPSIRDYHSGCNLTFLCFMLHLGQPTGVEPWTFDIKGWFCYWSATLPPGMQQKVMDRDLKIRAAIEDVVWRNHDPKS